MPQMLFTAYADQPVPFPPRTSRGEEHRADGEFVFDLAQAVVQFGVAAHTLRQLYIDTLGPLLTDEDAQEIGLPKPDRSRNDKHRRVLSDEDIQTMSESNLLPPRDHERALFLRMCERTGLDPLRKQIYWCYRKDGARRELVFSVELNIGGLRTLARRSGEVAGTSKPMWSADGEKWVEGWADANSPPALARFGVKRRGDEDFAWGVARWDAYAVRYVGEQTGEIELASHWAKMSDHMLLKCAEALAYRSAWPELFSGLYIAEEMEQSENPLPPTSDALDVKPIESNSQVTDADDSQISEPPRMPTLPDHSDDPPLSDEELVRSLALLGLEDAERRLATRSFANRYPAMHAKNRGQFNRMLLKKVKADPRRYKLRMTV